MKTTLKAIALHRTPRLLIAILLAVLVTCAILLYQKGLPAAFGEFLTSKP